MSAKSAKATLTIAASASGDTDSATFDKAELAKLVDGAGAGSFLVLWMTVYNTSGTSVDSDITFKTAKFEPEIEANPLKRVLQFA